MTKPPQTTNNSDTVFYGLPQDVVFCKNCVISNQRPNSCVEHQNKANLSKSTIAFNKSGICDACTFAEYKKQNIKWTQREEELKELCDRFRKNNGEYDCLVPGSGGKDSFYAAHILKYKYKMNPLTVTWAPHLYTSWGWENLQAWIHAGFDNYLCTPNGLVHRLVTRLALENLYHPFQPFIIGQKSYIPKMAASFNIALIFYGENEAEYGNPLADAEIPTRDISFSSQNDGEETYLAGVALSELENKYGLSKADLEIYKPISRQALEDKNIEVHYLGYYLKWHPQGCYYYAVENSDFKAAPERTCGTYSKYVGIDDKMDDFHFYTTFIKFGIGRASYEASQEIRSGDISRDEGVSLVQKFDGEYPERFFNEICDYLSINENEFPVASKFFEQPKMNRDYFDELTDSCRSPHLWTKSNGKWKLRKTVY